VRDSNWDFGDRMGHSAAHELGRLLLRADSHAEAGLMRGRLEARDLRRLSHAGLIFLPGLLREVRTAAVFTP
jgi:hypothetical protein